MNWERPYYKKSYNPFVFFVVFGVTNDNLKISRSKHRVEEIPKGLEIQKYSKYEHKEYIEGFYQDYLGKYLEEKSGDLYKNVSGAEHCLVIRGEIEDDFTLSYIRNIIGIIQCLCEEGAIAVLDLQTFNWYSDSEWGSIFFNNDEFNPFHHVVILCSQIDDKNYWLHTRGMRKFGRPDISVINVLKDDIKPSSHVINQIIHYQAYGAIMSEHVKINIQEHNYTIDGTYTEDFENYDFNNAFYVFDWSKVKQN
ncbi:hypothetical protein KQI42_14160 [Tissierella sp. MSJ-40]|uniref:Uncharacterized protein n=1 Tax=Tissierella simiarum TaxID=2841534 RepID=A0ABS6E8C0_9FIRM|nr:hypothetical protein [Tissierella simiarum]MBU5439162.1 hypothetical protein [Tissierella simiarum]